MRDSDQYAHGWVKGLRMDGEGKVYASIDGFSDEVRAAIETRKLRYVSAEIFEFDGSKPEDPPYLRAVALLGRDTPAVVGTKIASAFARLFPGGAEKPEGENKVLTFGRKLDAEEARAISAPEGRKEEPQEDLSMAKTVEELERELAESRAGAAAFQKELAEARAGADTLRKELEERKSAGRKAEAEAFFGKLRDEGKLAPAAFAKTVDMDARLPEAERAEFRALFASQEPKVDTSGKHAADKKGRSEKPDAFGTGLSAKVRAFRKERKLGSFAEAAQVMHAEKPELFEEEEAHG